MTTIKPITDIAILVDEAGTGVSPAISNGDFVGEQGLRSAVLVSLFTDARVSEEELPDGEHDRRGWWGDAVSTNEDGAQNRGSKLWLLAREKDTEETRARAKQYCEEALQWLITDRVVDAVAVEVESLGGGFIAIRVVVTRESRSVLTARYDFAVRGEAGRR